MEQLTLDSHPSMKNLVCHQLCIPVAEPQQKDRPPVITTAGCINQGQPGLSPNSQQREGEKEGDGETGRREKGSEGVRKGQEGGRDRGMEWEGKAELLISRKSPRK